MRDDKYPNLTGRRDFFRQASCAAVGTWALTSTIRDLRLINSAMAFGPTISDYKALVCIFLSGGNDANNWIVPTDPTTFDTYTAIRGNLALPLDSLQDPQNDTRLFSAGTTPYMDSQGHTYSFHPSCPELATLFNEDKLAVLMNVGTLVRPTTRAQYTGATSKFYQPPQLFSHSDQVTQWQTSIPDQPPATGWGGRVADLTNAIANPSGNISMSVSLNGANTFEVGNLITQYHVSTSGAVTLSGGLMTNARTQALKDILGVNNTNLQRAAYSNVVGDAIATGTLLNQSIQNTTEVAQGGTWTWSTPFPNTTLGNQLKMVARLIEGRGPSAFNMNRQIFFCSVGGYDTHTSQVAVNGTDQPTNANGAHYKLLDEVSSCMFAFERAMQQLGVTNNVTAFTASDFSRTLPTNSQGSDHGWGSHHVIVGGAVKGGQVYGKLPTFAINGPDDTGLGRWIPTLAVDQYSATLAKWFGLNNGDLTNVFPNLGRFDTSDLGFML